MYARLLTSSKIDTAATITILIALMLKIGFNSFSLRLVILLIFVLITGPVSNHIITRSAYLNGISLKGEDEK